MSEEVMIQSIKLVRGPIAWGEDLAALAKDIKKHGLRLPVLLDADLNLIDGLRRIAAFESLGWTTIPAVVATTYEEAMAVLERVYGPDNPITDWARAWELFKATEPLLRARTSRLRSRYMAVPIGKRGTVPKQQRSRELLDQAMGHSYVTKAAELYRQAEEGSALAQTLVKLLETGEITVNTALHRLHERGLRLTGNITDPNEQRFLLSESARTLSGIVKGLKKLDKRITVPARDLTPLLEELKKFRLELATLIRDIEKGHTAK